MTEKRFNITANEDNWLEITDNGVNLNQLQVCDLLNELHEEKEIAIEGIKVANDLINRYGGDELKHKWKKEVNVND